ncbi:MAG: class I SAM-dependent methyltransferase [Bacilli bacterium]|nr:class I SAM-dependent methyltransferase [Bacilli bacterium]
MSKALSIKKCAHLMMKQYANTNGIALDMTLGNGFDTLFLSQYFKDIIAFDIQEQAIIKSKELLKDINNVKIFHEDHYHFDRFILEKVDLIIFNLGYLPQGDHKITTIASHTIKSIKKGLTHLKLNGGMVIVIYPGHLAGYQEKKAINQLVAELDSKAYHITKYEVINNDDAPLVININKNKGVI